MAAGGAKPFDPEGPGYERSGGTWEAGQGTISARPGDALPEGLTPSMVEAAWGVFDPWLDGKTGYDPDYGPHEVYVPRMDFEALLAEMWTAMDAARSAEAARRKGE